MNTTTVEFRERFVSSQDGLKLYVRDYGDPVSNRTPVLCLPGLTRNSKDFHGVARRLAGTRRVLAADIRGRGRSEYDPDWHNYQPATYVGDVRNLLAALGIEGVFIVGTSMGGILAMAMGAAAPTTLRGALLNDVGPDVAAEGLVPIIAYVEQDKTFADWPEVIGHLQAFFPNLPAASESEWMAIAKASYVVRDDGRIVQDWDPNIVKPLRGVDTAEIDLWPYFRSLARFPLVGVRGEKSNVLTADTFQSMSEAVPSMAAVTVCGVGHAPTLAEPEVVEALERALEKTDESHH